MQQTSSAVMSRIAARLQAGWLWIRARLSTDWQGEKYVTYGLVLLLLTLLPTIFYYLNFPSVEINPDSKAYLHVVDKLREQPYALVDPWRLPGYPLLIWLVSGLAGKDNLMAVSVVQAGIFVLTALEIYILAALLFKRAWLALIIGLLVGTNLVLLSYAKPIMSEGLAMWEVTTLALATVVYLRRGKGLRYIALCLVLLVFTRPEWLYLAPLLYGYLLLIDARRGMARQALKKTLIAMVVLYCLVGGYIGINRLVYHYAGLTAIENFNWMGKILQYDMWHWSEDQHLKQQLDYYVTTIDKDPYHILAHIPEFTRDYEVPAGKFARDIILHHPIEFLIKTIPYIFASLTTFFDIYQKTTPYMVPLGWLQNLHRLLYNVNGLYPLCVLVWLLAWGRKQLRAQQRVWEMGALVLLGVYALCITTLGGYRLDDYMRVHTVFNPLLIVVTWGSILLFVSWAGKAIVRKMGRSAK